MARDNSVTNTPWARKRFSPALRLAGERRGGSPWGAQHPWVPKRLQPRGCGALQCARAPGSPTGDHTQRVRAQSPGISGIFLPG